MAAAIANRVNGLSSDAAAVAPDTDAPTTSNSIVASSAKRKRDAADDGDEVMTDADAAAGSAPDTTLVAETNGNSAAVDGETTADRVKRDTSSLPPSKTLANGKSDNTNDRQTPGATTTSTAGNRDEKRLIRDYFEVLQSFDKSVPPILKRPLPEPTLSDEPQAKRQKSDGTASPLPPSSVADKIVRDAYALLDDLVLDVAAVVNNELATLEASSAKAKDETEAEGDAKDDSKDERAKERALAQLAKFREKAHELYRRETAYPKSGPLHGKTGSKINGDVSLASNSKGEPVLTVFGNAPQPRQLFSSLPLYVSASKQAQDGDDSSSVEEIVREDEELDLGGNITLTRVFPPPPAEKVSRVATFGELFPSPRNLPPLQPPKAPKSTTKSTTLGFYHPELAEKSKYRSGSYTSQPISVGQWLDYSNATPSSQIKTRQRERAQSLAGHKPSTTELEMSEMEALFRGAFSSFAPSKDDSAAVVSAAHVGRMWWQRVGHRVFQRMVEAELDEDEYVDDATLVADVSGSRAVLDEEALEKTIAEWDDSLIDPSLDQVMGSKPDTDKDVDEVLQDVSDLIVTLASYQRNRNLTLPTSQDRFSADPVNADMLRNGTLAQQPSEEEMLTYQTLKAQLSLIIQSLPPYAVARLNSDKLAELNISTKIEVRSEEYHGVLEEDEVVIRARQAAQAAKAAVSSPQRAPAQRNASVSANHNYGPQFNTPGRSPMPAAGGYYQGQHLQTPSRSTQQHRPSVGAGMPAAALPPHVRGTPQAQPQYRPSPNGYGNHMPALAKAQQQPSYRGQQQPVPAYPGSPGQPNPAYMSPQRVVSQPQPGTYGSPALQPGTPQQFRYPQAGTPGYPQQQVPLPPVPQRGLTPQQQQQQQQQARLSQQGAPYPPSPANGAAHLAQQQRPIQPPPQHAPHLQQRFHPGQVTPGQPPHIQQQQQQLLQQQQQHQQQQLQQQQQQQQQLLGRPPYGNMTPQAQGLAPNAAQRHFSTGSPSIGATSSVVGGGPFGYHTVMDQPQQQRLMEQARARASAHERSMGFGDKISQGGVGQVAGLAGIGLGGGGGVDVTKLAAARANMPGGAGAGQHNLPSPLPRHVQPQQPQQPHQPQQQQPHAHHQPSPQQLAAQPMQYPQQQQQQQLYAQQGAPSPALNGTPQHVPSPSTMASSVSPAPSGGFQRPS